MTEGLFSTNGFIPRTLCGSGWSDGLVALHVVSDLVIAAAYVVIPAVTFLTYAHAMKRERTAAAPDLPMVATFLVFMVACGASHALDALMFVWPIYVFSGIVLAVTAASSFLSMMLFTRRYVREVKRG